MVYWLIAVPTNGNATQTENELVRGVQGLVHSNSPRKFEIPELKIGTMETLLAMSDDLARYDVQVEQIVKKLFRAYFDLQKMKPDEEGKKDAGTRSQPAVGVNKSELLVNEKDTPAQYLDSFTWLSRKFPQHAALRDLSDMMLRDAMKADDELKQYMSAFNEVRIVLEAIDRKETGSLLVKPLASIVDVKHMVETEHLTTIFLVVPKKEEAIFLSKYETMEVAYAAKEQEREAKTKKDKEEAAKKEKEEAEKRAKDEGEKKEKDKEKGTGTEDGAKKEGAKTEEEPLSDKAVTEKAEAAAKAAAEEKERLEHEERMARLPKCNSVVPRSARKLSTDDEFVLYSVIVFKKGLELVKNACRQERYTVRAHQFDPGEETRAKEQRKKLTADRKKKFANAVLTTKSSFSDCFVIWMHIKAMRVFVEVVLRYGLPVNFQSFLLRPKKGMDKKLRESLAVTYRHLPMADSTPSSAKKGQEDDEATLSQFGTFYPYVYFEVDLSFEEEQGQSVNIHV